MHSTMRPLAGIAKNCTSLSFIPLRSHALSMRWASTLPSQQQKLNNNPVLELQQRGLVAAMTRYDKRSALCPCLPGALPFCNEEGISLS